MVDVPPALFPGYRESQLGDLSPVAGTSQYLPEAVFSPLLVLNLDAKF